jgi:hypothetical protein
MIAADAARHPKQTSNDERTSADLQTAREYGIRPVELAAFTGHQVDRHKRYFVDPGAWVYKLLYTGGQAEIPAENLRRKEK